MALIQREYTVADTNYLIEIHVDDAGKFWFKAEYIAHMLKYGDIQRYVEKKDQLPTFGNQTMEFSWKASTIEIKAKPSTIMINESGLQDLCLDSEGKQFRHWMTSHVLPSIRNMEFYKDILLRPLLSDEIKHAQNRLDCQKQRLAALDKETKHAEDQLTCQKQQLALMNEKMTKETTNIKCQQYIDEELKLTKDELKCKKRRSTITNEEMKHTENLIKCKRQQLDIIFEDTPVFTDKLNVFAVFAKGFKYKFIYCQKSYFQKALKEVEGYPMLVFCQDVPNSINFFDILLEMIDSHTSDYESWDNFIRVEKHVDLMSLMKKMFEKYKEVNPIYFKNGASRQAYRDIMRNEFPRDVDYSISSEEVKEEYSKEDSDDDSL